jgi:transposase InsO family protein
MLVEEIKDIHEESHRTYGSPRITDSLKDKGYVCSRPRVARLMRKNNIRAKTKRKFKITTFSATALNELWTSDITYIRTRQGWLYLTVILDVYNRQIVGWSMSNSLKAIHTTIPALMAAYTDARDPAQDSSFIRIAVFSMPVMSFAVF